MGTVLVGERDTRVDDAFLVQVTSFELAIMPKSHEAGIEVSSSRAKGAKGKPCGKSYNVRIHT